MKQEGNLTWCGPRLNNLGNEKRERKLCWKGNEKAERRKASADIGQGVQEKGVKLDTTCSCRRGEGGLGGTGGKVGAVHTAEGKRVCAILISFSSKPIPLRLEGERERPYRVLEERGGGGGSFYFLSSWE